MNSQTPYGVALRRGIVASLITGLLTMFTMLTTDASFRDIVAVAGVAGITPLALRFGWEGTVDHRRQNPAE